MIFFLNFSNFPKNVCKKLAFFYVYSFSEFNSKIRDEIELHKVMAHIPLLLAEDPKNIIGPQVNYNVEYILILGIVYLTFPERLCHIPNCCIRM